MINLKIKANEPPKANEPTSFICPWIDYNYHGHILSGVSQADKPQNQSQWTSY